MFGLVRLGVNKIRQVWREEPWYMVPVVLWRKVARQAGFRLHAASVQRLRVWAYHVGRRLGLDRGLPEDGAALLSAVRRRRGHRLFLTAEEAGGVAQWARQQAPEAAGAVVDAADAACRHQFRILGHRYDFGPEIGWHQDPVTGFRWPQRFHNDMQPVAGRPPGTDVKYPYELSRFHHAPILGMAYHLTGEGRYARALVDQFTHWYRANPYGYGVNWTCAMDVGIRAANLLSGFHLCLPALEAEAVCRLYRSMHEHGLYIAENLENRAGFNSNHYLADLVGLYYIGLLCPELPRAATWLEFATRELEREIQRQTYPDGMDFEASVSYHRLTLEFFFYPALLGRRNGRPFSSAYLDRLHRMFAFTRGVLKPGGTVPQIGDNDSGRLHMFQPRPDLDHTYLLHLAALFFADSEFKMTEELDPEAAWIMGPAAIARWQDLRVRRDSPPPAAFPDAGIYVLRAGRDYMCLSCGPNGQAGNGGHAHNDKLSFELTVAGHDCVVDPGTFTYTRWPEWRNRFRGTAAHNTLMVAGQEQNRQRLDALFSLPDEARGMVLEWRPDPAELIFHGAHSGYERLGLIHRRRVVWRPAAGVWQMEDELVPASRAIPPPAGPVAMAGFLHLAPGVTARVAGERADLVAEDVPVLSIQWPAGVQVQVLDDWYSPAYGVKIPAHTLQFTWAAAVPARLPWEMRKLIQE